MKEFPSAKAFWDQASRDHYEDMAESDYDSIKPSALELYDEAIFDFRDAIDKLRTELGGPVGIEVMRTLEASLIDIPPVEMVYPEDLSRDSIAEAWKTHFEEPEMER